MLLNNLVITLAVILQSFAVHPAMFIIGRFVSGINSGRLRLRLALICCKTVRIMPPKQRYSHICHNDNKQALSKS